jgi:GcrA cell cycle regulator
MAPTEFHEALGTLGLAQQRVAAMFGVGPRSVRRWQYGERRVPCGVGIVFRLLAAGAVTIDQVERAAVHRINGGPKPFIVESGLEAPKPELPPVPLVPASEQSANLAEAAPEQSATDPNLTSTAAKVAALTARACHWPIGDPASPEFRFCGRLVSAPPYWQQHRGQAYLSPAEMRLLRRRRRSARSS